MATIYPKLSEQLFVSSRDKRVMYLSPEYPDWITINVRYKRIFDLFDGNHSVAEISGFMESIYGDEASLLSDQVATLVQTSRIFDHIRQDSDSECKPKELRPKYVYLTLTDVCNLNCTYCYAKERKKATGLESTKWFSFVDKLLSLSNPLAFTFTGGEPLLVPFIFDLAGYINDKGSSCILLTNGTRIDSEDVARRIADSFEVVKVSLDSTREEVNSKLRGENTLDKVRRGIELLDRAEANYTVLATVSALNKDYVEEFAEHFNNRVYFQPLYRMGSGKHASHLFVSGDEYYDALTRTGLFRYLSNYHKNIHTFRGNPSKRCAMAVEELSIAPNGDLYPCHMLHYDELRFGNLDAIGSLEDTYRDSEVLSALRGITVDSIHQCKDCIVRNFCAGGCRARLDFHKDSLEGTDPFCSFERSLILDALLYSYG